ncbi:MAG: peptidyl-alpha-hydroxyglycine alpha-amidating lyase family protein [Gammaproteobacteria bacterium]|nr:peptidyl-alpha-hydroxyglycine alpha-amidating lyase family protein [Gammaproteobacteria bacterium]MDE0248793.1 peptidyl-alpha-hydroxyglycine alpha-amidating lyase family protein [Gammaproteobacteria bacterium]
MAIPTSLRRALPLLALALLSAAPLTAQNSSNAYAIVDGWAKLPGGREMGAVGKVTIDPDGRHIWAVVRCDAGPERFGSECLDSDLDPVIKFDPEGNVVESFGSGLFIWPHGIDVDSDGNVWVTDSVGSGNIPAGDTRGHQVIKFSGQGDVLMTLGSPGMEGGGPDHFTAPADVAIADNGDVFIADGHGNAGNNRVVKFDSRGNYLMEWGRTGYAPGEFRALHAIDIDPNGRIFVGDRSNSRIQIFDPDGNHLATWTQFGRPSGIAFDGNGRIYVADSESDDVQNPGWEMGIRIGEIETGWVTEFIRFPWADPRDASGNGAEFVAVDSEGNMYGGEPRPRQLRKYIRVRP